MTIPPRPPRSDEPAIRLAEGMRALLTPLPAAKPFLDDVPPLTHLRPLSPHTLPVLAWLPEAARLSNPTTAPLVGALVAAAGDLAWGQTYTAADFGPDFLDRYGWTELVGLRGPFASTTVAFGMLLLGPGVHYPPHAHAAAELYLPLAGTALWMRGREGYTARAPGVPILHAPWEPHAMRTAAEPMLALYAWRGGDLAAKSRIIGEP